MLSIKWEYFKEWKLVRHSLRNRRDGMIKHPDLKMEPFSFEQLIAISGELDIIGMNPNNDSHIFR